MIGPRIGLVVGPRVGLAIGVGADQIGHSGTTQTTITATLNDSSDPVVRSSNFSYTIQVNDATAVDASLIVVAITLDAAVTWVSSSGTGWSFGGSGQNRTATRSGIEGNAAAPPITVVVTAPASGSLSSSISVSGVNFSTVTDTEATSTVAVAVDAASGLRLPASAAEWTSLLSVAGSSAAVPDSLWLMQEASGDLADSIGATALTAGGVPSPSYQQTVTGLTRKGVSFTDASADRFRVPVGVAPDPSTTSQTYLWLVRLPAAPTAADRVAAGINGDSTLESARVRRLVTSGYLAIDCNGVRVSGSVDHSSRLCFIVLKYDRTNSACVVYTELEKIIGTYSAGVIDGYKGVGGNTTEAMSAAYGCMWKGAPSEIATADIKAILGAILGVGTTIPWS